MEVSIFLAKFLGLYMLLVGLFSFLRKPQLEHIVKEMISTPGLLALSGFMSLLLGLAIVIAHPIYTLNWHGLITLLGYLSIIKGIIRIWFPLITHKYINKFVRRGLQPFLVLAVVLGLYLTYCGFMAG